MLVDDVVSVKDLQFLDYSSYPTYTFYLKLEYKYIPGPIEDVFKCLKRNLLINSAYGKDIDYYDCCGHLDDKEICFCF